MKQPFHLGDWYVEPGRHRLSKGDESAHLQPKMLAVLEVLVQHEGQTVEKNELLDLVWPRQYVFEEVLKRVILKLRQALGDDSRKPRYIETIHKKGYRLVCPVRMAEFKPPSFDEKWTAGSPFKSLHHFELEDSRIFFGRSAAISEAESALSEQQQRGRGFLLISGASGAGKSSFVRAGLIPALMRNRQIDKEQVTLLHPVDLLSVQVDSSLGKLFDLLERAPEKPPETNQPVHLLLIDQFEEALLLEDRDEVMDRVHKLARSGTVDVLLTIREDYLPALSNWPAIARLRQGAGTLNLGPPSHAELAEMLQGPANAAGFYYEISDEFGSLKKEILSTAYGMQQALPLLQFLLHQMYEEREQDTLGWASYRKLGGLVGAISKHAEAVLSGLDSSLVEALTDLLEQLTQFDLEHQRISRRRMPINEVESHPQAYALAQALVDARLLVSQTSAAGTTYLSLVHETLLEHWPRARAWAEENLDRIAALRRVRLAHDNWQQAGKSTDMLLNAGKPMTEGVAVAALPGLEDDVLVFITESQNRVRRRSLARRFAAIALVGLTVLSVAATFIANQQRDNAEHNLGLANRAADFVIGLFNTTRPNTSSESLSARDMLNEGVRRIPTEFADDDATRARLLHASGRLFMQTGELERAENLLNQAFETALDNSLEKSEYAWSLAELRDVQNQDIADEREDELVKISIENLAASGATDEDLALAYWRAARLVMPEWRYSPYYWEKAYDFYFSDQFSANPDAPLMLAEFATLLAYWRTEPVNLRDTKRALSLLAHALRLFREQGREADPDFIRALENAARLESSVGSSTRGIELQRKAAVSSQEVLGRLHIATPFRWQMLGDYLLTEGLYAAAETALQQAASMYLQSYGTETNKWYETSLSLAEAWFYLGKHQDAGLLLDTLEAKQVQVWQVQDHPETWHLWQLRGHLARSAGNNTRAGFAYTKAIELVGRIAAQGNFVVRRIVLELNYLSMTGSGQFSAFVDTAFIQSPHWISANLQYHSGTERDLLIDLRTGMLQLNCQSPMAFEAAKGLRATFNLPRESESWRPYYSEIILADCGYLDLDRSGLKARAEKIAELTHPSTYMAIEAMNIASK